MLEIGILFSVNNCFISSILCFLGDLNINFSIILFLYNIFQIMSIGISLNVLSYLQCFASPDKGFATAYMPTAPQHRSTGMRPGLAKCGGVLAWE
jgi:hypothetical protein